MPRGRREDGGSAQTDSSEEVHPVISSLLGKGFIGRNPDHLFAYDRDEMIRLSTVPLSTTRPEFLSEDFDGDDGKFSPFKWLQHKWEQDGIENRPVKQKVDALKMDACLEDGAVLSPQRRGFSGGCCPPEDKNADASNSRKGWTGGETKGRWSDDKKGQGDEKKRNAKDGEEWKVTSRSRNWREGEEKLKQDFKLPFQKPSDPKPRGGIVATAANAGGNNVSWRTAGGDSKDFRPAFGRGKDTGRRGPMEERLPEWAEDGPTTMDDMIELKGFEETNRRKNKRQVPSENCRKDVSKDEGLQLSSASEGVLKGLPETDAEFAAILGLLDVKAAEQPAKPKEEPNTAPVTGSRLSRFFKNHTSELDTGETKVPSPIGVSFGSSGSTHAASTYGAASASSSQDPSILARIFAHSHGGHGTHPQSSVTPIGSRPPLSVRNGISLEELERGISGTRPIADVRTVEVQQPRQVKGNPLQDPLEQATLMQKLQRISIAQQSTTTGLQQAANGSPPPPPPGSFQFNGNPHAAPRGAPPQMPELPSGIPGAAPFTPPQVLLMQQFFQAALVQATQACGGVPPPHVVDQIRHLALRQMLMATQQNRVAVANAAALLAQQQKLPQTTSLIPSSVARHMKASSSQSEEKKESLGDKQTVVGQEVQNHEDAAAKVAAATAMQKLSSQAAYQTMMAAMSGGLPVGAWRAQHSTPQVPVTQAPPINQLAVLQQHMILAQAHQHQQQLLAQAVRAKLLQQQQQQKTSSGVPPAPSTVHGATDHLHTPSQNPLERLLAAAGVQPLTIQPHADEGMPPSDPAPSSARLNKLPSSIMSRLPPSARPMCLEDLERHLTESK